MFDYIDIAIIGFVKSHSTLPLKMADFQSKLRLSRPTVYRHINKLIREGCIEREGKFFQISIKGEGVFNGEIQ